MSLKTFVKIGKIENLSDARYCAGMMVDILGFNLEEGTEGFVSAEKFKEITDWVAGVKFCGEFANAQVAEVKLATTNYPIDYIEIQNPDQLEELSELSQSLIYKIVIRDQSDLDKLTSQIAFAQDLVEYISIQCTNESLYEAIEQTLTNATTSSQLIRDYDLSEENADKIAEQGVFSGIELEGSPEDRPGFKDYGKVMDILEVLEVD